MQKEKMEMITAVISLILSIVAFINGICKNYNIYFIDNPFYGIYN